MSFTTRWTGWPVTWSRLSGPSSLLHGRGTAPAALGLQSERHVHAWSPRSSRTVLPGAPLRKPADRHRSRTISLLAVVQTVLPASVARSVPLKCERDGSGPWKAATFAERRRTKCQVHGLPSEQRLSYESYEARHVTKLVCCPSAPTTHAIESAVRVLHACTIGRESL